ncbi:HAD family hydrolase [Arsenicicoccus dermatophilus]|uniref:HAD family hydrolase n=1 Tax=Arsenicicoccus dermatophilus TaxID=1076331 RepID=UPI003917085F
MNTSPTARELIANCSALLLDFDGPMAALMPPPRNAEAAQRVRHAAAVDLPSDLRTTTDHLAILRHLLDQPDALARAEAEATAAEIDCARTCEPAPWLPDLLTETHYRGIPWAVVTNNSPEAVCSFLSRFKFAAPAAVVGREPSTVARMKPNPFFVSVAVRATGASTGTALFVGDSVSDMSAGIAAGARMLGYAKTPGRGRELICAGANALVSPGLSISEP